MFSQLPDPPDYIERIKDQLLANFQYSLATFATTASNADYSGLSL